MRVFKTKWFARFARRERISDTALCEAVKRVGEGLIDADLGGNVLKQRIARPGGGRSGGYRTILLIRIGTRAVFAYGFAKNDQENINRNELEGFQTLAAELLEYEDDQIEKALDTGALLEMNCSGNK